MPKCFIYPTVRGDPLERHIARAGGVQRALRGRAALGIHAARAKLAGHHSRGNLRVQGSKGAIDYYINLIDPAANNWQAAAAIEYGHWQTWKDENGKTQKGGWVEGIHLFDAARAAMRG